MPGRIEEGSLQVSSSLLIIGLRLVSFYLAGFKNLDSEQYPLCAFRPAKAGEAVYLNITVYPTPVREVEYTVS